MSKKIVPLHSLVVVPQTLRRECSTIFPAHDLATLQDVQTSLVGPGARPDLEAICSAELCRRVDLKLRLGQRAVIAAADFSMRSLRGLVERASGQGASIVLFGAPEETLGGFVPDMVVQAADEVLPAMQLPEAPLAALRRQYRGITVVGDVHGDREALKRAVEWAGARGHFLWFLGDLLDYGNDPVAVIEDVYHLVMAGRATLNLGNHERKIASWLADGEAGLRSVRLNDSNKVTTSALRAMSVADQDRWQGRFSSLLGQAHLIRGVGNVVFTHGAVHPDYWGSYGELADQRGIENFALYGEPDPRSRGKNFTLSYRWVERIPAGKLVMVGHDTRSTTAPMAVQNRAGGRAVFLDTGCGKGGVLSTADLRFLDNGRLRLENFNVH